MKITKTRNVKTPERGTPMSAGLDFFIPSDYQTIHLSPGMAVLIPSGIKANVPVGKALIAHEKSGICTKLGLIVGAKVVDEDYQGEIHLHLLNVGNQVVELKPDMKIVQFLLIDVDYCDIEVVDEKVLFSETTQRGEGGFGSTGQ